MPQYVPQNPQDRIQLARSLCITEILGHVLLMDLKTLQTLLESIRTQPLRTPEPPIEEPVEKAYTHTRSGTHPMPNTNPLEPWWWQLHPKNYT